MGYLLRPQTFGGLLSDGLKLYREHCGKFLQASALTGIPLTILAALTAEALWPIYFEEIRQITVSRFGGVNLAALEEVYRPTWWQWLILPITFFGQMLQQAILVPAASDALLGHPIRISTCARRAWSSIRRFSGASLITSLGTVVGLLLCFVPGILFLLHRSFFPQIVLIEGAGAGDALRRSGELAKGCGFRMLSLFVGAFVINMAIYAALIAVLLPFGLLRIPFVSHLFHGVPLILLSPLCASGFTLAYLDARHKPSGQSGSR